MILRDLLPLLPGMVLAACWAATARRCHTLRRHLDAQHITARLQEQAWARDVQALRAQADAAAARRQAEDDVLDQARAAVDAAYVAAGSPRGGTDG